MPCRRFLSTMLAVLAACWMAFSSSSARAQATIVVPNPPVRTVIDHPDQAIASSINRSDCLQDDVWTFTVNMTGAVGLTLEVWAGVGSNDCTQAAARTETTANCTRVYAASVTDLNPQIRVHTRDIALLESGLYGTKNTSTVDTCTPTGATTSASQSVILYFMLFASGETAAKASYAWPPPAMMMITPLNLDLIGPGPPSGVDAQGASTFVKVGWAINADLDVQGYRIFCDPPLQGVAPEGGIDAATSSTGADATCSTPDASSSTASDASSDADAGDGSSDTGSSTTSDAGVCVVATDAGAAVTCAGGRGAFFPPNGVPSLEVINTFQCGKVGGNTQTSTIVDGFAIGTSVAIAVASVDLVGNIGGFSTVSCAKTEAVNGFMDLYHQAGGTAGSGFCSMTSRPGGRHSREFLYGSLVLGAMFAMRMRRRRAPN